MSPGLDSWLYCVTAFICLVLGFLASDPCPTDPAYAFATLGEQNLPVGLPSPPRSISNLNTTESRLLEEQTKAKAEFRQLLRRQQEHPTGCSRVLVLVVPKSGSTISWIESLELIARALKVAMSTERRLILSASNIDYDGDSVCQHSDNELYCRFIASTSTSSCPPLSTLSASNPTQQSDYLNSTMASSLGRGIQDSKSEFFNAHYYGPSPVVALPNATTWPWPKTWLIDAGLSWERAWGAFWVRSQVLSYLYNLITPSSEEERAKNLDGTRMVVTLVWDLDAQQTARHRFARDSNKTHAWDRILANSNHIRDEFVKVKPTVNMTVEWTFAVAVVPRLFVQDPSKEFSDFPFETFTKYGWKVENRQETEDVSERQLLESIVSSDFLIGSFSSPWFRVSAALQTAENARTRSLLRPQQHWSLDLEWVESF
jgi:hypothetical protein